MISALGFSENRFDPNDPGRLCRGRERWIEPWELDDGAAPAPVFQTVMSGASFSDDGAADARRGLGFSGVDPARLVVSLFPGKTLLAFMEDGHPADIPDSALGVEAYEGYRAGGRQELGLVRWHLTVTTEDELRALAGDQSIEERVRGLAVLDGAKVDPVVLDRLFALVGFATMDSPPARYQPAALPALLQLVRAVVLFHRDKHGPALAVYSQAPLPDVPATLRTLCDSGSLLVPFAIPPMLARWDRALAELRTEWMSTRSDEFPVPPAPEPSERPRRRRFSEAEEEADDLLVVASPVDAPAEE